MSPPFTQSEYENRQQRVQTVMAERKLDALVIGDPANMNWLTGFDAWSFYVPQVMVIEADRPPVWIGRAMDAGALGLTTYLGDDCIVPYPEDLIQRDDTHPVSYTHLRAHET